MRLQHSCTSGYENTLTTCCSSITSQRLFKRKMETRLNQTVLQQPIVGILSKICNRLYCSHFAIPSKPKEVQALSVFAGLDSRAQKLEGYDMIQPRRLFGLVDDACCDLFTLSNTIKQSMILFCIRGHPYKLFPHYSRIDARKLFLNVLPSYGIVYQPNQNTFVLSLLSVVLPHLVFKVP